jgi:hypothetical protein
MSSTASERCYSQEDSHQQAKDLRRATVAGSRPAAQGPHRSASDASDHCNYVSFRDGRELVGEAVAPKACLSQALDTRTSKKVA